MRLYICVFVIFIGFIEGEYIDCKATCIPMNKKLDFVYYEIEAVVKRSKINGNLTNFYCKDCNVENPFNNLNGNEVYATLRSFQSTANQNQSKFCEMQNGYDGRSGLLAPCLMVNPGQTLIVKVINNFPNAIDLLQSGPPSKTEWWETLPTR